MRVRLSRSMARGWAGSKKQSRKAVKKSSQKKQSKKAVKKSSQEAGMDQSLDVSYLLTL